MESAWILPALLLGPILLAGISLLLPSPRLVLWFCAAGTLLLIVPVAAAVRHVLRVGPLFGAERWLMVDALSAYHLAIMIAVFSLSALYAVTYFGDEIRRGVLKRRLATRYGALWFGSLAAMMVVLLSNNLGMLWVGIEATTLLTAFLICIHVSSGALEAMWKYLLMCSVGVAFAFTGTLLVAASATAATAQGSRALLWTSVMESATRLDPLLLKAGFIFLVVGYGTKAGLAPMHNWLPDAHSQAPAPVSAIFSGFLLNTALYCIFRYLPVVEAATGQAGWARGILVVFGIFSIVVAAAFIIAQHDVKRLLAYHSVEHIGIITLGAGLGGLGTMAALFHTLNHSLCKCLSFCCAGEVGRTYGTYDMKRLGAVLKTSPVWGTGLVASLLALLGVAPFALFLSEFLIVKAAVDARAYWALGLFLLGIGVVFVGALKHVIAMAWEPAADAVTPVRVSWGSALLVFVPLAILLFLGVWMPDHLADILLRAARIMGPIS